MKSSAGILFYNFKDKALIVFLVHPGGPYWKNKDQHAWSIPKGEMEPDELPFNAALREVQEETGIVAQGNFIELSPLKQKSGKVIYAWGLQYNIIEENITSETFELEWPPKSGTMVSFPEIDKGAWYSLEDAREKILPGQLAWLDELYNKVFVQQDTID